MRHFHELCVIRNATSTAAGDYVREPNSPSCSRKRCVHALRRTVLIDVGANCGNSLELLQRKFPVLRGSGVEIYAFEANPTLNRVYMRAVANADPRVHLHENAAWVRDGDLAFHLDQRDENTSDDMIRRQFPCDPKAKLNAHGKAGIFVGGRSGKSTTVKAVDFAAFLCRLQLCERDFVIVKIDIEGTRDLCVISEVPPSAAHPHVLWQVPSTRYSTMSSEQSSERTGSRAKAFCAQAQSGWSSGIHRHCQRVQLTPSTSRRTSKTSRTAARAT